MLRLSGHFCGRTTGGNVEARFAVLRRRSSGSRCNISNGIHRVHGDMRLQMARMVSAYECGPRRPRTGTSGRNHFSPPVTRCTLDSRLGVAPPGSSLDRPRTCGRRCGLTMLATDDHAVDVADPSPHLFGCPL